MCTLERTYTWKLFAIIFLALYILLRKKGEKENSWQTLLKKRLPLFCLSGHYLSDCGIND